MLCLLLLFWEGGEGGDSSSSFFRGSSVVTVKALSLHLKIFSIYVLSDSNFRQDSFLRFLVLAFFLPMQCFADFFGRNTWTRLQRQPHRIMLRHAILFFFMPHHAMHWHSCNVLSYHTHRFLCAENPSLPLVRRKKKTVVPHTTRQRHVRTHC